jgi:hypothetical protein
MRRVFLLALFLIFSQFGSSHAQQKDSAPAKDPVAPKEALKPEALVEEWFGRLNNLDDWFILPDGKEENEKVVDRLLEMFSEDAYLQVGPSENQLGSVTYHGREAIRKWVDNFSRTFLDLNYRTHFKTKNEQSVKPVHVFDAPWGEKMVAVEITGVYASRRDRTRFWVPGAAFFTFDKQGKVQELRLYMLRDEREETKTYTSM